MSNTQNSFFPYKAIETCYRGYRMRSRLEARWAVFLDTLNIAYQYEPEGFDLDGMRYLPDFFLPSFDCWLEIKPDIPTPDEREKAIRLALATAQTVLLFVGAPWHDVRGYGFRSLKDDPKEIAEMKQQVRANHPDAFWLSTDECFIAYPDGSVMGFNFARALIWSTAQFGECDQCEAIGLLTMGVEPHSCMEANLIPSSPRLLEAYTAARSARFEFGEKGERA